MSSTTTFRRIAAHYAYYRRSLMRNAIVSLSSDGTVTDITQCDNIDSRAGVEFYSGILIPGMVNAHCHLELSYLKGAIPPGGGFVAFADGMGRTRNVATPEERAAALRREDGILWRQGVSAVGDISNGATSFPVKAASKVDYTTFLELFGLGADVSSMERLRREADELGLKATVSPHATYSLNDNAFRSAVGAGRTELPLSIHFMESESESELYSGTGEMKKWYDSRGMVIDFAGYCNPANRIVKSVPSERDIMLIHNCFVTEEVIDLIESHFAGKVTWVLCPRSNDYISGIYPPVGLLRSKGVRIAVGTDSLASNTSLSMVEEMKAFKGVPLEEILGWVTVNGAEALNIQHETGAFEIGQRSGVVLLSGVDMNRMELAPESRTERIL